MKVLVVTNGHGEDQLAVCLVQGLRHKWPQLMVEAIPLVGAGTRLEAEGIAVAGPRVHMPSGGMVRPQLKTVIKDLRAGLLKQFAKQRRFVSSRRQHVQKVIAVGDVLAGWVAGTALPDLPLILVATAKSEYIHGHFRIETLWMRRRTQHVFARDELTAEALRRAGVRASWAGNLMMDAFTTTGRPVVPPGSGRVVGLFPGSREDAYVNLHHLALVLVRLADSGKRYTGIVPLAPGLHMDRAVAALSADGWQKVAPNETCEKDFVAADDGATVCLQKGGATLHIVTGAFGDVLVAADVVVGLAGTANEQAAGLGKPVVAFPGPGVQFGGRFLRAQQLLLGDALAVTEADPSAVARQVERIFEDEQLRKRMSAVGRQRMGPPGAARRMAQAIMSMWRIP